MCKSQEPARIVESRQQVFRPIDNSQVFRAAAFDRGLRQPASSAHNEVQRLYYHALATAFLLIETNTVPGVDSERAAPKPTGRRIWRKNSSKDKLLFLMIY
jgi:hypothetical protein